MVGSPGRATPTIAAATPALTALQLTAALPADEPPEPLQLADPDEELPPLGEDSLALSGREGPDPLLARERSARRSTADLEPRGASVLERKRPLYDAVGIKSGGFTIFPTFSAGAGATTDAVPGGEDVFGWVRAAAVARSDWSRHELVFDGFANHRAYATYSSEDGTSWLARARGRLDVHGRDRFTAQLSSERIVESRGTIGEFVGTNRPVRLTRNSAELGGHAERGRFTGQFHLEYSKLDYDEGSAGGPAIVPGRRDSDIYRAEVELGYQFSGPRSLFLSVGRSARRYDVASAPLRDSNEIEVLGGIQGEITPLISGRLSVGYVWIDFLDPSVSSRGAVAVDARLQYLFTELTTISLNARRTTRNVASPTSPLAIVTDFRLGADHELLRNLILSASAVYQTADFSEGLGNQTLVGADFKANWLVSPRWRASFGLGAVRRRSSNLPNDRDFDAVTATVGVTFQL